MNRAHHSRGLGILLAVSFALTVASFLVSRGVSDRLAMGTRAETEIIVSDALPAGDLLANVRTELRRTDALVDALFSSRTSKEELELRRNLERSRAAIAREWDAYRALPAAPGEKQFIESTESNLRAMDESIAATIRSWVTADRHVSLAGAAQARSAIARTDEDVKAVSDLNRQVAREAAERIAHYRDTSRRWGFLLDAISVVLAVISAYVVYRVLRRLGVQYEQRIGDLEHFAGRVAHDIRSPLSTVLFALDFAKRGAETDSKTQSMLDRGIRTLQRVGQLVDGLLVFALAGKPPPEDAKANVRQVLGGVVEEMRPIAEEKAITLENEPAAEETLVACSPGVLVSMTSNLLTNAIKYMGDMPVKQVSVKVREMARSIRVQVSDSGPGIAPELRSRIFDPYVRGAESMTVGFGLGLATVRRLAEAHGGAVGVQQNTDGGSLFWFELPRWEETIRRTKASGVEHPRLSRGTGRRAQHV
jgi:signal transduction histidine kinase